MNRISGGRGARRPIGVDQLPSVSAESEIVERYRCPFSSEPNREIVLSTCPQTHRYGRAERVSHGDRIRRPPTLISRRGVARDRLKAHWRAGTPRPPSPLQAKDLSGQHARSFVFAITNSVMSSTRWIMYSSFYPLRNWGIYDTPISELDWRRGL